jgi:hypothetical protein
MHVNDWGSRFYLSAVYTKLQELPRIVQIYMELVQFGSLNATVKSVFRQTSWSLQQARYNIGKHFENWWKWQHGLHLTVIAVL